MKAWRDENPCITNRLACLVRDFLNIEYLDISFSVFSSIGIHLIEHFLTFTTSEGATYSKLKDFIYLYTMKRLVTKEFFLFDNSWFEAVSADMLGGIKRGYNSKVVGTVKAEAMGNIDDCIMLVNFIMPELRTVHGRQRRDYGFCEDFVEEFPVEMQTSMSMTPQFTMWEWKDFVV